MKHETKEVSDWFVNMLVGLLLISAISSKLSWWVFIGALAWSAVNYLVDKPYDFSLSIAWYAFGVFIISIVTYVLDIWYIKTH